MFILKINNNSLIKAKIIWKIYIINNLKAKILININIMRPEKINIIILTKQVYIKFYKIIISIKIQSCLL